MDRMIHLSLNSLDIALRKQAVSAQNSVGQCTLAGYRADVYENFGSLYLEAEDQLNSRAFAITTGSGAFDIAQGRMRSTQQATDMAIDGKGFFVTQKDGLAPSSYQTR